MIAWIVCCAIFCGCSLTAWILWIRIQPRVTREEFQKLVDSNKLLNDKMNKAQQALVMRGMWGP